MPIDQFNILAPFRNGSFQVITKGVGSRLYHLKDATDDGLLERLRFDGLVKLDEPRLAVVVHDNDSFDHLIVSLFRMFLFYHKHWMIPRSIVVLWPDNVGNVKVVK
jgi:hypothetical protein